MASPRLLIADVDDTLLGDPDGLIRLTVRLRIDGIRLVPCSSRPIDSLHADDAVAALPTAAIIGALGTQVERGRTRDLHWEERFADFPRAQVSSVLAAFGPAHAPSLQGPAKVSHAIARPDWPAVARAVRAVDPTLRVVTSGESNVDVIPRGAGKATSARYVAAQLGVPWDQVVTAGDAEIDAELLVVGLGIAVGNATPGLRTLLAGRAFQADACFADGVIEGLNHYGRREGTGHDG